jgi:hypothetical protein
MKFWKITPGQGGYLWREQKLNECIAMGWSETKSLKGLNQYDIRSACLQKQFSKSAANQLNAFVNSVQVGDKVIASTSGKGVYAVGTIIGNYEFNRKLEYKHSRKVRWETTFWHPVDITSLNLFKLSKKLYNKFHGRSSLTIRELEADEWNVFCEQLNTVSTPFRNLGIWAGLLQSPEYENEVMILFSHMLQHFNMRIIQFGVRFPDAIVERKKEGKWQKQYIEFELRSSGFQTHLPDCKENEEYVIVCWEDNWVHPKKSHFEIIELKSELGKIL